MQRILSKWLVHSPIFTLCLFMVSLSQSSARPVPLHRPLGGIHLSLTDDSYRGPGGLCDLFQGIVGPLGYAARTDLLALQTYCESTQSDDQPSDGPLVLFPRNPPPGQRMAGSSAGPPPDNGGAESTSQPLRWMAPIEGGEITKKKDSITNKKEEQARINDQEEKRITNKRKELDRIYAEEDKKWRDRREDKKKEQAMKDAQEEARITKNREEREAKKRLEEEAKIAKNMERNRLKREKNRLKREQKKEEARKNTQADRPALNGQPNGSGSNGPPPEDAGGSRARVS